VECYTNYDEYNDYEWNISSTTQLIALFVLRLVKFKKVLRMNPSYQEKYATHIC
jgi:hypothetical protein